MWTSSRCGYLECLALVLVWLVLSFTRICASDDREKMSALSILMRRPIPWLVLRILDCECLCELMSPICSSLVRDVMAEHSRASFIDADLPWMDSVEATSWSYYFTCLWWEMSASPLWSGDVHFWCLFRDYSTTWILNHLSTIVSVKLMASWTWAWKCQRLSYC